MTATGWLVGQEQGFDKLPNPKPFQEMPPPSRCRHQTSRKALTPRAAEVPVPGTRLLAIKEAHFFYVCSWGAFIRLHGERRNARNLRGGRTKEPRLLGFVDSRLQAHRLCGVAAFSWKLCCCIPCCGKMCWGEVRAPVPCNLKSLTYQEVTSSRCRPKTRRLYTTATASSQELAFVTKAWQVAVIGKPSCDRIS